MEAGYFRTLVNEAFALGKVDAGASVRIYVSQLLAEPTLPKEEAFAIQVHRAHRPKEYADIGDQALILSSMFPENVYAKKERFAHPGLSYVQDIGSISYELASNHGDVYAELSFFFKEISDALQAVTLGEPQQHILQLYERYKITGSKAVKTTLRKHGMVLGNDETM